MWPALLCESASLLAEEGEMVEQLMWVNELPVVLPLIRESVMLLTTCRGMEVQKIR